MRADHLAFERIAADLPVLNQRLAVWLRTRSFGNKFADRTERLGAISTIRESEREVLTRTAGELGLRRQSQPRGETRIESDMAAKDCHSLHRLVALAHSPIVSRPSPEMDRLNFGSVDLDPVVPALSAPGVR